MTMQGNLNCHSSVGSWKLEEFLFACRKQGKLHNGGDMELDHER